MYSKFVCLPAAIVLKNHGRSGLEIKRKLAVLEEKELGNPEIAKFFEEPIVMRRSS
jgi:hypothetical protein